MGEFDIISALEDFATAKGWHFVYGFDDFYKNQGVQKDYAPGELVFLCDFIATPTLINGRATTISYTCLLMLGRKFDPDTTAANLDETSKQKYDRRLQELMSTLANGMAEFACNNELEVTGFPMSLDINVYDTNIDFAIANNATFLQG